MNKKYLLGSPTHLESSGVELGIDPIDYLALNLPPYCNFNCPKCSTKVRGRKVKNPLSIGEVEALLAQAKEHGAKVLTVSGEGEPLFDKDFFIRLIETATRLDIHTLFATNGSLLDCEMVDFLKAHKTSFTVSLDTLDPVKYESMAGRNDCFQRVLDNIECARKAFRDTIRVENGNVIFRVGIHSILSPLNLDEIAQITDFCADDLYPSSAPLCNSGECSSNEEFFKVNTPDYDMIKRTFEENFLTVRSRCGIMQYGLCIGYDGEALLADHFLESGGLIGNIREIDLLELKRRVDSAFDQFVREFGFSSFCIVRDQNRNEILKILKDAN